MAIMNMFLNIKCDYNNPRLVMQETREMCTVRWVRPRCNVDTHSTIIFILNILSSSKAPLIIYHKVDLIHDCII